MAKTRSEDALDRADRLIASARKSEPAKATDSEWDIDTARHEIEELKAAVAKQPSQPEIHNHFVVAQPTPKHESEPPTASGFSLTWKKGVKLGKLPPWATVVIALTLGLAAIAAASIAWIATHS
jgi:hypothetical protein